MFPRLLSFVLLCALWSVGAGCGGGSSRALRLSAYLGTDVCSDHVDAVSCAGDTTHGCAWTAVALACPAGVDCPSGFCRQPNPCEQHVDAAACAADTTNGCAWAAVDAALAYCPAGTTCPSSAGGFCYAPSAQQGSGCACACPLYCPDGQDCPPCDCACPPPSGGTTTGGGTCTCACATCAPGETCPPCDCGCTDGSTGSGGGGTCGGTCTCACPVCDPSTGTCPPCDCVCDGGPAPTPTSPVTMCTCPTCTGTGPCPACDCPPDPTVDPCTAYSDATTCSADTVNQCAWIALGVPCQVGTTCISGVCQRVETFDAGVGAGDGCVCGCPACAPGSTCPPCGCDCTGGGGGTTCP